MKKVLKIFSFVIVGFILFIILLLVTAKIKENAIADKALERVSETIQAPMLIDNVSFNLIRGFPYATIEFKDIWLGAPELLNIPNNMSNALDTLASINKIFVSVKSKPLMNGEFEIQKVEIKGIDFNYYVDSQGKSNFDFLMDTTATADTVVQDTAPSQLNVLLNKLVLSDIVCRYTDSLTGAAAVLTIPEMNINGKIENDKYQGTAIGSILLSNTYFTETNLHKMQQTAIDLNVNYVGDTVQIRNLDIATDGANFNLTGNSVLKDTIETHLKLTGKDIDFSELIKYAPEKLMKDLGITGIKGKVNLNADINGFMADSTVLPELKMNINMSGGAAKYEGYPAIKNLSFNGFITNGSKQNNATTSANFKNIHFETDKTTVDIAASVKNLDRLQYNVSSQINADLGEFKYLVPDTVLQDITGKLGINFSTKGVLPDSITDAFIDKAIANSKLAVQLKNLHIKVDSSLGVDSLSGKISYDLNHLLVRDLGLQVPSYKASLNNTSLDAMINGSINDMKNLEVDLKSYHIQTGNSVFHGDAKVKNLEAPEYDFTSNLRLQLDELVEMAPDTLVNSLSGEILGKIQSSGKLNLDSIEAQINEILFKGSSFNFTFNDISAEMPDSIMNITGFSSNISITPDSIYIKETGGNYMGIDFAIDSLNIKNLYETVIQNQEEELFVQGNFNLGDLDYDMFLPFMESDTSGTDTSKTDAINEVDEIAETNDTIEVEPQNYTMLIKGKLGINSIKYNKVLTENYSAKFKLTDSIYIIEDFTFDAFKGNMSTSLRYANEGNDEVVVWVKNVISGMDVQQILTDFDNFQEFLEEGEEPPILAENISGFLSSEFHAQAFMYGDSLSTEKLRSKGEFILEEGGIYNYPAVVDMEKYLPTIGELDTLDFKTLTINTFLFKSAVYVPVTLMISNKIDASFLGMQTFGEDYSYHIEAFIRDLLGKSDKNRKKQDAKGEKLDDFERKGGILLKSFSIDGKSRSGIDSKEERAKMKNKVKVSQALLELRFHPNVISYDTGVE